MGESLLSQYVSSKVKGREPSAAAKKAYQDAPAAAKAAINKKIKEGKSKLPKPKAKPVSTSRMNDLRNRTSSNTVRKSDKPLPKPKTKPRMDNVSSSKPIPKPKRKPAGGNTGTSVESYGGKDYSVGKSKGGVSFKEAFAHYRKKGAKTFTWNGKKYNTKVK